VSLPSPDSGVVALAPPDAAAIARAYGLGRPIGVATVAARGELGRIWRLPTGGGTWAVKELLRFDPERAEASAAADLAFQEAALAAGVPLPRPIRSLAGGVLTDVGERGRVRLVRVYEWVDLAGRAATPALVDVARILGTLHAAAATDDRPMDPWYTTPPPDEVWPERVASAAAAGAAWSPSLGELVPVVLEAVAATGPVARDRAITCHLDFNPENVLVTTAGGTIVVDWENSGPAPADQELASVVAEFVRDPADTPAFLAAYAAAGGSGSLVDRSSFALTAVGQANLVATYAHRAIDPSASAEDRARAAHWVAEIAANAFTVERFDAWLASTGEVASSSSARLAGS
jgi:Ser/Thr protein kinase RdoA (MazF antagonist)